MIALTIYTVFTVSGSITAHWWALRSEIGKSTVGASHRYAQIPVAEWEKIRGRYLNEEASVGSH